MSWCLSQDLCSLYPSLSPIGTMLGASVGLLFSGTFAQLKAGPEPHRPKLLTRRALSSFIESLLQLLFPVATSAVPPSPTSTNHLQLATHQSPRAYLSAWLACVLEVYFLHSSWCEHSTIYQIHSDVPTPSATCSPSASICLFSKVLFLLVWQVWISSGLAIWQTSLLSNWLQPHVLQQGLNHPFKFVLPWTLSHRHRIDSLYGFLFIFIVTFQS